MKVALIDVDKYGYECAMSTIASALLRAGHEVKAFYHGSDTPNNPAVTHGNCDWCNFDLKELEAYNPDRVVMFNGYHPHRYAVTQHIRRRWKTLYMEHGWLPQRDFFYIDTEATGGRSAIAAAPLTRGPAERIAETMAMLKKVYAYRPLPHGFPKDYILVPLQLGEDTSIVLDSPYFKTMSTLMGFVRQNFPDIKVVVKKHPFDKIDHNSCGTIQADPAMRFNDLVQNARAVVGINSTTLIEALVHGKPVATLGYNVASNKGVYVEPEAAFRDIRKVLTWCPEQATVEATLDMLYHEQFSKRHPGLKTVAKITQ